MICAPNNASIKTTLNSRKYAEVTLYAEQLLIKK